MLEEHALSLWPPVWLKPDDDAILFASRSPEGGAVGSHRSIVASGMHFRASLGVAAGGNGIILTTVPFFEPAAIHQVLSAAVLDHRPLCLVSDPASIDEAIAAISKSNPAAMVGDPDFYSALLSHRTIASGKANLDSVKLCLAAGAAMPAELKERVAARTGAQVIEASPLPL